MKKAILSILLLSLSFAGFSLPKLFSEDSADAYNIKNISVDLSWENLIIQQSNDSQTIFVYIYCNKYDYVPGVSFSNSKLTIKSKKTSGFFFNNYDCTVIVKLPSSSSFDVVALRTTSGDINSETVIEAGVLYVVSTSGDQTFALRTNADDTSFTATSGDIKIDSSIGAKLKVETTSGSITVGQFEGTMFSAKATSGTIKLSQIYTEDAFIDTTSGSISLDGTVTENLGVNATSGTVGLILQTVPADKTAVSTTSGTIFTALPGNADFSIIAKTTSGAFINTMTGEKVSSSVNYKRDMNEGGPLVMFSATSGRVTLDSIEGNYPVVNIGKQTESDIPVVSFDDPIF